MPEAKEASALKCEKQKKHAGDRRYRHAKMQKKEKNMPTIEETSMSNYRKAGNSMPKTKKQVKINELITENMQNWHVKWMICKKGMLKACLLHICHSEKKCINYIMGSKHLW